MDCYVFFKYDLINLAPIFSTIQEWPTFWFHVERSIESIEASVDCWNCLIGIDPETIQFHSFFLGLFFLFSLRVEIYGCPWRHRPSSYSVRPPPTPAPTNSSSSSSSSSSSTAAASSSSAAAGEPQFLCFLFRFLQII